MSKKNRLSEEIKKGVFYLNAGLIAIILLTGVIYLYSIGGSSQMGYSFSQREKEYNELKNENENLKQQVLKVSSFNQLSQEMATLKQMEKADPEYFETRLDRLSKK